MERNLSCREFSRLNRGIQGSYGIRGVQGYCPPRMENQMSRGQNYCYCTVVRRVVQ